MPPLSSVASFYPSSASSSSPLAKESPPWIVNDATKRETTVNILIHLIKTQIRFHVPFRKEARTRDEAEELGVHVPPLFGLRKRSIVLIEGVEIEPVEAPQRREHLLLDVLGLARSTTPHSPLHAQLLQDRLDGKEVQRAEVQVVVVVLRGGALLVRPARQTHLHRLRVAGAQVLVPVRGVHHGAPLLATV